MSIFQIYQPWLYKIEQYEPMKTCHLKDPIFSKEVDKMPKETRAAAEKRAKVLGIPKSQVVRASDGGYYIAPQGIGSSAAKKAYAECRSGGDNAEYCAKVAWTVEERSKK